MLEVASDELARVLVVETDPFRRGWLRAAHFELNGRLTSTAGRAYSKGRRAGLVQISVRIFAHPDNAHRAEKELRDTVRHELAHLATPGHGHDRLWERVARSYGDSGDRCHDLAVAAPRIYHTFRLSCTGCTWVWRGKRQSYKRLRNKYQGRTHECRQGTVEVKQLPFAGESR
jgi:predicted SprT family Zn-dependent metalloprotease